MSIVPRVYPHSKLFFNPLTVHPSFVIIDVYEIIRANSNDDVDDDLAMRRHFFSWLNYYHDLPKEKTTFARRSFFN